MSLHAESFINLPWDSSACIITGSGCCCFVMSLVVWFQTVSGIVLFYASQCSSLWFSKECRRWRVWEKERERDRSREVHGLCMSQGLVSVLMGKWSGRPEASLNSALFSPLSFKHCTPALKFSISHSISLQYIFCKRVCAVNAKDSDLVEVGTWKWSKWAEKQRHMGAWLVIWVKIVTVAV